LFSLLDRLKAPALWLKGVWFWISPPKFPRTEDDRREGRQL